MSIASELRERLKLRYAGDCKCGQCSLVPDELIRRAADAIEAVEWNRDSARKTLEIYQAVERATPKWPMS